MSSSKSWLSRPERQGIPIGNLTSQFGANLYLSDLDFFIQRVLKPKAYFRYMDDLLLLSDRKENLILFEEKINFWFENYRRQNLNLQKTSLVPLSEGIDYLGFRLEQVTEPKDPLLILPQRKKKWDLVREARKLKTHNWESLEFPHELAFSLKDCHRKKIQKLNSRLALLVHTQSFNIRKQVLNKFNENCLGLDLLKYKNDFKSVKYYG